MPKFLRKTEFEKVVLELWNRAKNKFIQDIAFDTAIDPQTNKPKNTLKKTINGQPEEVINHVVTEWQDLKYATQSNNYNMLNPSTFEDGKYYNINGLVTDTNWGNFKIPCRNGDTFTLFKKSHDSINLGLLNGGRWVQNLQIPQRTNDNGWVKYTISIPQNVTIDSISIPVHKTNNDYKSEVMLFSNNVNAPNKYIPFTNNRVVSIDGGNVAITFDSSGTTLTSGTTVDAIKELDGKIANAGGGTVTSVNGVTPVDGNVTVEITNIQGLQDSLNNKVDRTEVGNDTNKIPRLNNGKLVDTIIPELAITRIVDATNQADALAKVNSGNIQVGDSVRLTGEQNKVYQYTGGTTGIFTDRFIEISQGDATVRTVNNQTPTLDGNITIYANQISGTYDSRAGSIQNHLNTIKSSIDGNTTRIARLESRLPSHVVGEFMVCYDKGDSFTTKDGAVFLHLNGRLITHSNYPDLAPALGITGTVSAYHLPNINNITDRFDNGLKSAVRKHYVCAKI